MPLKQANPPVTCPMHKAMTYPQEKGFLVIGHIAASSLSWIGAILSTGDIRWLAITCAASFMMSCLLAITFKGPEETIQYVSARCGLTIFGGVFVTKYLVWQMNIEVVHTDPIALAGLASLVSIMMFTVGFKALRYLEKRSDFLGKKFIDSKTSIITGSQDP